MRIFFTVVFFLLYTTCISQMAAFQWAKNIGGVNSETADGIVLDALGNTYMTGNFYATCDFDPGPGVFNMTPVSSTDIFVAKYDVNGNLIWCFQLGGVQADRGDAITVDPSGNIYVTGYFAFLVDFDPGPGVTSFNEPTGAVFIAKYSSTGNFIWASRIVGGSPRANDIRYDVFSNSIGLTGTWSGTADFDTGAGTYTIAAAYYDIYFARYDLSGNFVMTFTMGGSDSDTGGSIAYDASGNIYISGQFVSNNADFDPGPGTYTLSAGGTTGDGFLAKYSTTGTFIYAFDIGSNLLGDVCGSVKVDGSGNAVITGYFSGTVDFNPGPGTATFTSTGGVDAFLARYDASGNYLWAFKMGSSGGDSGKDIALDAAGDIYLTGGQAGIMDLDPGPGTATFTQIGSSTMFVAKYTSAGSYIWSLSHGSTVYVASTRILLTAPNTFMIGGYWQGTGDFNPGPGVSTMSNAGLLDIFFEKYIDCSGYPSAPGAVSGTQTICVGTTNTYSLLPVIGADAYAWTLPGGWTGTSSTNIISPTSSSNSGTIYVTPTNSCGSSYTESFTVSVGNTPATPGAISGLSSICASLSTSYNISAVAGATSYSWTLPGGWSGTSATNLITTTVGLASGNITVSASNACGNSTDQTKSVTVNSIPAMPGSVNGNTLVCSGSSTVYSISPVAGASSYFWTIPGGWTGASATNSLTTTSGTVSGDILVASINSCGTSMSQTLSVTINTVPSVPVSIFGNTLVCTGSINNYTLAPVANATSYNWTLSGGWSGTSTTNSITATAGLGGGNISASAANVCGTSAAQTLPVTINPTLTTPGSIAGNTTLCSGTTNTYSIAPIAGAISYSWTLPGGWSGNSSTNTISTISGIGSGNISVFGINLCGNSPVETKSITVVTVPPVPVGVIGSSSICSGSLAEYTISVVAGATSYSWLVPSGWSGSSLTTTIGVTPDLSSGSLSVMAINACGSGPLQTLNITVNQTPNVMITGASTLCAGSSLSLTAGGAFTYSWSNASASAGISVSPSVNTIYTVTGTAANGCQSYATKSITVQITPTVSVNSGSICQGNTFSIIPSGAENYSISGGLSLVSPPNTTIYTVVGSTSLGCVSSNTAFATVSVAPLPTITVNSGAVCSGNSFTIVAIGANTYSYSGGSSIVSPGTNTSYNVTGTSSLGCVSVNTAVASVSVAPLPTISVNSGSICLGNTFTINPSGADSYIYSGGSSLVSPTTNTSYAVSGSSSVGCISSNTAVVNVSVIPLPTVSVNSGSMCSGSVFTITAIGASTYTYSGGSNLVSPATNTSYAITGTSSLGCVSSNTAVASVSVISLPTVSVNSGSICAGSSFTLLATGASTYDYPGGSNIVAPTSNTSYAISGTNSLGCVSSNTVTATITVAPLPTVSVNNGTICSGNAFILVASGAANYTYAGGSATVSPMINSSYTVTGTSSLGCVAANIATCNVTVLPSPTISVNSGSVCLGQSFTLTPSGASTYNYSGGSNLVSPVTNTSYAVTGTSSLGCISSNTAISNITVMALPVVTIQGVSSVCLGNLVTLTATGASSYVWNTNANTTTISVSPSTNSSYTVTGTDNNGCQNIAVKHVLVNPLPNVTASTSNSVLCFGNQTTLNGGGAITYLWTNGVTNNTAFSPGVTANYTVVGTDLNGCQNVATLLITVNNLPVIFPSASSTMVCAGQSITLNGNGANTYAWSGGVLNNIAFFPTITLTYSVTGTDANGCQNTAQIGIIVNPLPTITATSSKSVMCEGETFEITLVGFGANLYQWSTGENTQSIVVVPLATTQYTLVGTDANGCVNAAVAKLEIIPCLGIDTMSIVNRVCSIYPNPTQGVFVIESENESEVMIINSKGQTVHELKLTAGNNKCDLTEYSNGIYFVIIRSGERVLSKKVIKE